MLEGERHMDLYLARNLSRRAILVALHQREHGPRPVAVIARDTGLSVRSVYLALEELQNLARHDHDLHGLHGIKEPVQNPANQPPAAVQDPARNPKAPAPEGEPAAPADDPVVSELVSHGIWPGAARRLVALVGAAAVRLQLAYHAFRLARGFRFRRAAAAFLYSACRNPEQYPAPEGFHAAAHLEREGIAPPARTPARPAREPEPVAAPLTLEDRLNTIRGLMASSIPAARRRAAKLAHEWGLEVKVSALVELVAPAPGLVAV